MVDEIASDTVVTICLNRDFDFRSDAVSARDQDRFLQAGGNPEHSPEATESTEHTRGESRFYQLFYPILHCVRGVEIDAGASVAKRIIAHAGSSSSNATRRRMSLMRWSISARVTVMSRSIENFSTANEPITDP